MKLTNYQKQSIVRAIIADIPEPNEGELTSKIEAAIVAAMSPDVQKVHAAHPKALKEEYLADLGVGYGRSYIVGDANTDIALKPFYDAHKARLSARDALDSAVCSCSTLKQLQTMFPEFIKYMPTEAQPTKNLPALANVVSDLVKLGWPKTP